MNEDNNKVLNGTEDGVQEALADRNAAAEASVSEANAMQPELEAKLAAAKADIAPPKKSVKIFIATIIILILLIIVRIIMLQMTAQDDTFEDIPLTNVAVQNVERGSIQITAPVSSRIEAANTYNITPLVSGEVKSVNVTAGSFVVAGQVLFSIDGTQAQLTYNSSKLQYENAKDSYNTAQISVSQAESGLTQAKNSLDRMQKLYDAGTISKSELEQAENAVTNANSALEQAKSSLLQAQNGISSAQNGMDQAADGLKNYTVTAPAAGYVSAVNVKVGDISSQGQPSVVISDTSVLELNANVSEYLISSVKKGEYVDVYVSSVSDKPFTGLITNVSEVPSAGAMTYPVTVRISDPTSKLKAGMFAEIHLSSENRENVIVVPSGAVVTKEGQTCVFIMDGKKVKQIPVKVGIDNGTIVEITEGLKGGESLVVKGQNYVDNGDKVNVVKQNTEKKEK